METENDIQLEYGFTAVGIMKVSDAALAFARQFSASINSGAVNGQWLPCFDWATARRMREGQGEWQDLGPGLDVGASKRDQVPAKAITKVDGFEFAVSIPAFVWKAAPKRLIDLEGKQQLVLR